MPSEPSTVLITGGGTGICRAVAIRYIREGHTVIIAGRRLDAHLKEAQRLHPELNILQGDVSTAEGRIALVNAVLKSFSDLNVLVNNTGIQRSFNVLDGMKDDWATVASGIGIIVSGPIHLTLLLVPHLKSVRNVSIVNVSSGLSFVPKSDTPIYSATKVLLFNVHLGRQGCTPGPGRFVTSCVRRRHDAT